MRRATLALGCGLALFAPASPAGGPWAAGARSWYADLTLASLASDSLATPGGTETEIPEFERRALSLYAEYGLDSRWTAILRAPMAIESSIESFGSAYGPGDVAVALQRQLLVDRRTQLGRHVGRRSWLALNVSGVEPWSARDAGAGVAAGVGDGVRYLSFGPQLSLGLAGGWSLVAGVEDTARELNLATGLTARLGVALER